RTSVRTCTRSAGPDVAGAAATPGTGTWAANGAEGTAPGVAGPPEAAAAPVGGAPGTEPAAPAPSTAVATGVSGARCSLPHSIHSRVATISQAKIRKVRVWFIRQAGSFAAGRRRSGGMGGGGGHCAVRVRRRQRAGAAQRVVERLAQRTARGRRGGRAGHQHIGGRRQLRPQGAEFLAQGALDPVAADRASVDLARYRQAQAGGLAIAEQGQGEQRGSGAAAVAEDAVEFGAHANARLAWQAAVHGRSYHDRAASVRAAREHQALRRLRPLARRRARILRPSAVAMRARKPWSRLRLRLLGWKVRLVAMTVALSLTRRKE